MTEWGKCGKRWVVYKKSSKQIKILYYYNHIITTSATIYKYTSTQLQKTPEKILTTASMTRILIMFMVVEVIYTLRI